MELNEWEMIIVSLLYLAEITTEWRSNDQKNVVISLLSGETSLKVVNIKLGSSIMSFRKRNT